jgi:Cu+-exporting ATPase
VDVAGGPALGHLTKDLSREKKIGDIDVTLSSAPERIKAGKEVTLNYMFRKKGRPVNDLAPYLSAPMHLAIISADLNHFMHTHGEVSGMSGMPGMRHEAHHMEMNMTVPEKFGPKIEVHTVFPAKGLYQIFGQVQHQGKVILTSFMVQVD